MTVIEAGQDRNHRDPVEVGEISARDQVELKSEHHETRNEPGASRPEGEEGRDQFREVVEGHPEATEYRREMMQVPTRRMRHGLRLEVRIETAEFAPTRIAAKLDQPRAPHDAYDQPAEEHDHDRGRWGPREGAAIEDRAQEDCDQRGLEQLDFPAEREPELSNVDEGELDGPEHKQNQGVRVAQGDRCREQQSQKQGSSERGVAGREPEEGGLVDEARALSAREFSEAAQVIRDREQALGSEQRNHIVIERKEVNQIYEAQKPEKHETSEPVARTHVGSRTPGRFAIPGLLLRFAIRPWLEYRFVCEKGAAPGPAST